MPILYDVVDLAEVTGFARRTFDLEIQRNRWDVLAALMPVVTTQEIELEAILGSLNDEDEARIRAWDSESEIVGRQGISKAKFELPPVSRKSRIGEKERILAAGLGRASADATAMINRIYDDAARHARSIAARWARLRADALFPAGMTLTETFDRVIQTVSYGRPGPLVVTASPLWTTANAATAKPIDDLTAWIQTYIATNGFAPAAMITSSKVLGGLAVNAQIKAILQTPAGGPAAATLPAVNVALLGYGLPPLVTFDGMTRRNGSQTRLTLDTSLLMVPSLDEPLGAMYVGPTAESLELVEARAISGDDAPGLTVVVDKTTDPVGVWTKVDGVGFPWLAHPEMTMLATVSS